MTPHRVLLADDEAHITLLVARRLRAMGCEVRIARDGAEAWQIAQEWTPQLVITDLQMPYLSGIELATNLRKLPHTSDIPILMLTARGYILNEQERSQARISEMLSKPFSVRRVAEIAQRLLSAHDGTQREAA